LGRVSVVIPTAARPETLEITLRSVSRQVSIELIHEVIVSENLGDRNSEKVAALFPHLPIKYKFRDPVFSGPLGGFDHVAALFGEASGEFVALVCDDDLWSPGHLRTAVEALDRNPTASAHVSAYLAAPSEVVPDGHLWGPGLLWLAAGCPAHFSEYVYDRAAVLALCWILTPFTWSSLVARTEAAADARSAMTGSPHPFYADRLLYPALAKHGPVVYEPAIDVIYREYAGNWMASQTPEKLRELIEGCWHLVEAEAKEAGLNLPTMWQEYLRGMPADVAPDVAWHFRDRFTPKEIEVLGFSGLLPPAPARPAWLRFASRAKKALLRRKMSG